MEAQQEITGSQGDAKLGGPDCLAGCDQRKKRAVEISFDEIETIVAQMQSLASGAEEIVLQKEMGAVLEKLIATLPAKLREPIMLSTVEEFSPADIGLVLGMSEAAVRSRLFRARQVLRERLLVILENHHGTR